MKKTILGVAERAAEQNMRRGYNRKPLELWQVIASAYLEGLQHGAELERERYAGPSGQVQSDVPEDATGRRVAAGLAG